MLTNKNIIGKQFAERSTFLNRNDEGIGEGAYDSIAWAFEVHVKAPDNLKAQCALLYVRVRYGLETRERQFPRHAHDEVLRFLKSALFGTVQAENAEKTRSISIRPTRVRHRRTPAETRTDSNSPKGCFR